MDFHFLVITCPRVRPLLAAVFKRDQICGQRMYLRGEQYPRRWYEVHTYPATEAECDEIAERYRKLDLGLNVQVKFHAGD